MKQISDHRAMGAKMGFRHDAQHVGIGRRETDETGGGWLGPRNAFLLTNFTLTQWPVVIFNTFNTNNV
jgi:hypothetical protein